MKVLRLGKDPMDTYSSPIEIKKTKLSRIFSMKPREIPEKPGRSLSVAWDSRIPLVPNFKNRYSYIVTFDGIGNIAGNHYHVKKEELFIPIEGRLKIMLEDRRTKEKEQITISAKEHKIIYIPTNIAHVVMADSNPAILLVIATYPDSKEDELKYNVSE
jgi:hypothetical protein